MDLLDEALPSSKLRLEFTAVDECPFVSVKSLNDDASVSISEEISAAVAEAKLADALGLRGLVLVEPDGFSMAMPFAL